MTTATRTDIHRPSSPDFDPEDYQFIGVVDLYPDDEDMNGLSQWYALRDQLKAIGSPRPAKHQIHGHCGHCGANIRYAAYMLHEPTGEYITVGEDCLDNRFEQLTKGEFQQLRKAAMLNRERRTRKEQRETRLQRMAEHDPVLAIFGDYDALSDLHNTFLMDLYDQHHHRDLTTKQLDAAVTAIHRALQWKAERDAERASATEAPEGRVAVTGLVKSVKPHEGFYGITTKATVKDDRGFAVWVTVPNSVWGLEAGDRVTFMATLTRSDRDATFAFGKKPTKWVVLEEASEQEGA